MDSRESKKSATREGKASAIIGVSWRGEVAGVIWPRG